MSNIPRKLGQSPNTFLINKFKEVYITFISISDLNVAA
jgi:hypothetical protein